MVRPRRHQRRAARPLTPPPPPAAPPRGRLARILRLAERIAAFVEAGGGRVLRWLVAAWLRRLLRCAGDAGRVVEADQDGAEVVAQKDVGEDATGAPLVEEGVPGQERATAVAPKADPFEDGYALAELFEDGADELGEDPTARIQEGATVAAQERAPGATPVSKQAESPRDKRAGQGRADDGDARRPREYAGGSNPLGNVSSAKAPRFPREERRNRKHGEGEPRGARTAPAPSPAEDAVAGNPSAAKEEGRGRHLSSTSSPRHQEEDERERGEASGANTGRGHPSSSPPSAALGVHHENGELGEGGATASPTAGEVRGRDEGKNANTGATDDRGDSDHANSIATAGHDPASPTSRPVRDRDAASTGTRDAASPGTRDAAAATPGAETGDASAAAGADRATAEPIPANQKAQERGGTHAGALDTPAGDSDVVRVQPHFAASPAAGASGSRTRHQRFVPRKKNKKANPKASPLLIEVHQWEKDDVSEKEIDPEIHMHQTYKDKAAACRKRHTYCLMCHLENRETKLAKDQNVIEHHCETEHQCKRGGILCQKRGCFVRAKTNRDIGLHRYICHNLP